MLDHLIPATTEQLSRLPDGALMQLVDGRVWLDLSDPRTQFALTFRMAQLVSMGVTIPYSDGEYRAFALTASGATLSDEQRADFARLAQAILEAP